MTMKKQFIPFLDANKASIEASLDAANKNIWGVQELKQYLRKQNSIAFIFSSTNINVDNLIGYLTQYSYLQQIKFQTPRVEKLFTWRSYNKFELLPRLRPNGYYTHQTALFFHGIGQISNLIYFNSEQPARTSSGILEQSRIDNAFSKGQRLTSARTNYDDVEYWLLNGKQTGRYGVTTLKTEDMELQVTDLERTLVDITVRPAYAGGVKNVLKAYHLAQPRVSIQKLSYTIRSLQYVYPYYQSVGFYMDATGVYDEEDTGRFLDFGPFQYDFYLDYKMSETKYSEKWRLYYPKSLA